MADEKISYFEITNFQALDTLAIYSNISKIRLLIQITLWETPEYANGLSKKNRFSAEIAINYFPSHWKKESTNMCNAWVLRAFLLSNFSPLLSNLMGTQHNCIWGIPTSSKLELLCQSKMTSWYYIVTKSSIVHDLCVRDPPLVCFFSVRKIKF